MSPLLKEAIERRDLSALIATCLVILWTNAIKYMAIHLGIGQKENPVLVLIKFPLLHQFPILQRNYRFNLKNVQSPKHSVSSSQLSSIHPIQERIILNNILMKLCFFFFFFFNFHEKKVYSFCCIYLFSFYSLFFRKQTHTRKRENERLLLT